MEADYYGIKIGHPAHSNEVFDIIEWCKENEIEFFTRPLRIMTSYSRMKPFIKIRNSDVIITEEEMADKDSITVDINGEDWVFEKERMRFGETGTAFFLSSQADAMAFKLRWL